MKSLSICFFVLTFISFSGYCEDWVSIQNQAVNQGKGSVNVSDFCDGDSSCVSQVNNPSMKSYYSNSTDSGSQASHDSDLVKAGTKELNNSDFRDQASERSEHKQTVDLTDVSYGVYNNYVKDAVTNHYGDCEAGNLGGGFSDSAASCVENTGSNIECKLTLEQSETEREDRGGTATLSYSLSNRRNYPNYKSTGFISSGFHDYYYYDIKLKMPEKADKIVSISMINGCLADKAAHYTTGSDRNPQRHTVYLSDALTINGTTIYAYGESGGMYTNRKNNVTFNINSKVSSGYINGNFYSSRYKDDTNQCPTFVAKYEYTVPKLVWKQSCNTQILNQYNCSVKSQSCTDGEDTRTVNGDTYTKSCWEQTQKWACSVEDTCKSLPKKPTNLDHMIAGDTYCVASKKKCVLEANGVCLQTQNEETCSTKLPDDISLSCDSNLQCNGTDDENASNPNCQVGSYSSDTDMATAITKLSILNEIGTHFDADSLRFFSGDSMACSKGAAGSFNCCSDSGWASDIGAHSCNTEEKDLAVAKQKNLAIEVGTYCAEKALGVCIRHKTSYCVYNSEISKITMVAAQSQLGKSFGAADNPDCSGMTEQQVQDLNWDSVDWSPVIGDIEVTLPNVDDLQNKVDTIVNSDDFSNGGVE